MSKQPPLHGRPSKMELTRPCSLPSAAILSSFPPPFPRVSITFALHRGAARPLRARSRHLPPLACSVYGPLRDLQPRRRSIHPSPITSPRRRDCAISSGRRVVGFVSRNLRLMKRVPPLTNFTLSKPTKANVPRSLAAMSKPPPLSIRIRILSFTFNFGPPPRRAEEDSGLSQGEAAAAAAGPPGVACPRGVIVQPTDLACGDPASASGHFFPPVASTAAPL